MEQEAAQKLVDIQSHEPFLVAVRGIAPAEGAVAVGEGDEPGVGDGDAMGVGAEIAQDMLRATEWPLVVDDPVMAEQHPQPSGERTRFGEWQEAAVELKLTSMKCGVQRRTCRGRRG